MPSEVVYKVPKSKFTQQTVQSSKIREQVNLSSGSAGILYVVPLGKKLFVNAAWVSMSVYDSLNETNGEVALTVENSGGSDVYNLVSAVGTSEPNINSASNSNSVSYPTPVIVQESQQIHLFFLNLDIGRGGFSGWIEDTKTSY